MTAPVEPRCPECGHVLSAGEHSDDCMTARNPSLLRELRAPVESTPDGEAVEYELSEFPSVWNEIPESVRQWINRMADEIDRLRAQAGSSPVQVDGELVVELRRMRERYVDGYIQRKINHRNGDTDGEQLVTWDGEAAQRWDEAYPACAALIAASDTTSDEEPNE